MGLNRFQDDLQNDLLENDYIRLAYIGGIESVLV